MSAALMVQSSKLGQVEPHELLTSMVRVHVTRPYACLLCTHTPPMQVTKVKPRDLGDGATLIPLTGSTDPVTKHDVTAEPVVPVQWSKAEDKALLTAIKAYQAAKKATPAGSPAPKLSWTSVAGEISAATSAPVRPKADVKARYDVL